MIRNRQLRILIYAPKFYPSIGGLENLTLMLAREFIQQGNEVRVITTEVPGNNQPDVPVYYRPSPLKQVQLFLWCNLFFMPNISLKGCWLFLFNPFKKWVVVHQGWYERADGSTGWQDRIKLMLTHCVRRNISCTQIVRQHIPALSVVIGNCYDPQWFKLYPDEKRARSVVFVGRLVSDKGADLLLEACIRLWNLGKQFQLTIIGTGPEQDLLEQLARRSGYASHVIFKGPLRNEALARAINQHQIMVVPSKWKEPFGIVALEGLACGCAVLVSDEGGLPEAAGGFATTFKRNDSVSLANQLSQLLESNEPVANPELENYLISRTPQAIASAYLSVFNN